MSSRVGRTIIRTFVQTQWDYRWMTTGGTDRTFQDFRWTGNDAMSDKWRPTIGATQFPVSAPPINNSLATVVWRPTETRSCSVGRVYSETWDPVGPLYMYSLEDAYLWAYTLSGCLSSAWAHNRGFYSCRLWDCITLPCERVYLCMCVGGQEHSSVMHLCINDNT